MVRWKKLGLGWDQVAALTEDQLEQRFYGPRLPLTAPRPMPDMLWLQRELKRPAVTLEVLHRKHRDGQQRLELPVTRDA